MRSILTRGGVLEDRFWSPWPRSLKSSKITLSSAGELHYFLNRWNFVGKRQKPRRKFAKTFLCFPQVKIAWKKNFTHLFRLKKIFEDLFLRLLENFFKDLFFGEHLRLYPWALASRGYVLGLEPFVLDSTSDSNIIATSTRVTPNGWF